MIGITLNTKKKKSILNYQQKKVALNLNFCFQVEVKRAIPMEELRAPSNAPVAAPTKKVFLGGLPAELRHDQLRDALSQYGELIDVHIATQKGTEEPRGFGFAIFQKFESAKELCDIKYIKVLVSIRLHMVGLKVAAKMIMTLKYEKTRNVWHENCM